MRSAARGTGPSPEFPRGSGGTASRSPLDPTLRASRCASTEWFFPRRAACSSCGASMPPRMRWSSRRSSCRLPGKSSP
ncbi:MAG: hypothetical protein JNM17_21215 [Archangium sp.]|nr:hypothetical protein [Archangium sp.]